MLSQGGELDVSNHRFTNCTATQYGGVLYVDHRTAAQATLTSCIMINSRSGTVGGAVFILAGAATVQDSSIGVSFGPLGGAFGVLGGTLSLLRSNVSDGSASLGGGDFYVDGGDADIQGCELLRGFSQGPGGSLHLASGKLLVIGSTIRGVGAAVHAVAGELNLQNVQILNAVAGDHTMIHLQEQAEFRAVLLLVELDCGTGSVAIWSETPERVLDVVGLQLLPSECVKSPLATQVSNARFSGCSDHSACGVAADCTDTPVLLIPDLTNPECSCTGVNYPLPSAISAALAPYVRGASGGCATPRTAERVYVVGETVGTVVIELHKGESYAALPVENITLAAAMAGTGISSATWTSAVRYLPKTVPAWVQLQLGSGVIPAGVEQMRFWIVATSSGLAERSEAYQAHLDLSVTAQSNVTLTVPIFLSVSASTTAAVWGMMVQNGRCAAEAVGAVMSMTHSLKDQIDLHFVACDVEMLPVQHRLPSADDPREFSITVRHASGEALEGVDFRVMMDVTSPGKYVVQLTLLRLAVYTVQLVLADQPVATPLSIITECPTGRVPHGLGCGCAQGKVYNGETLVCEACPPNTFNNQTLPTDEQLACTPCPKHSVSPAASTSAAICQCNEGFYARTSDGLVHGEGDCVRCPAGTACETVGYSTQTLPLLTGWWRASNTSVDIKRCAKEGSGCVGGPDAWSCKEKLSGPLCVLCKDGPGHYYNKDSHDCRACGADTSYRTIIAMLGTALGLGLFSGILLYYCSLPVAKACKPKRRVLRAVWECVRSLLVKVSCSECKQ